MDSWEKKHFVDAFKNIQTLMQTNRDYLIELDSLIGDGDLGLTMEKAFNSAYEAAIAYEEDDLGTMLKTVGFTIAKNAPSTMGTLIATGFISIGKTIPGQTSLSADEFSRIFRVMAETISTRGKAVEGEKTLLDVLFPVARAVKASNSQDICERLDIACATAQESLEETKKLMNQHGKAAVFREKSIGLLDPGAAAIKLVIDGFGQVCN